MNKKNLSILFVLTVLCASLFLFGCKHDTIKFYRESAASTIIDKFKSTDVEKKPSGVIILKDNSSQEKNTIHFGPRDIDFDMPVRFK